MMTSSSSFSEFCLCIVASVLFNNVQFSHQSAVNVYNYNANTVNHVVIRNETTLPIPIPLPIPTCGTLNGFNCYRFNTGCYCVVTTQMNWTMAYNYCLNNNQSLLSIETQAKQDDLQVNLPSIIGTDNIVTQIGVWTSGAYFSQLGQFFWSSLRQRESAIVFSFSNWQLGKPNNQQSSFFDCVRLIPAANSVWADLGCNQYLPFICEF